MGLKRRQYDDDYKRRIGQEAARCTGYGQLRELAQREGIAASTLTQWKATYGSGNPTHPRPAREECRKPARDGGDPETRRLCFEVLELLGRVQQKVSEIARQSS